MVAEPSDQELLAAAPSQPGDAAALVVYGITLQALGRYLDACEPLLQATVLAPTNANAWLQAAIDLQSIGREAQAEHAFAALRELHPIQESMWFSDQIEEPLRPFAQLSRAVYLLTADGNRQGAQEALTQLVDAYGEIPLPRVQQVVAAALNSLGRFEEVIQRYTVDDTDPRLRWWVASALVTQGARLSSKGRGYDALASWHQVLNNYGDDPDLQFLVARALGNQANVYGRLGQTNEQLRALEETIRRYEKAQDPVLRRRAAAAIASRQDILQHIDRQHTAQEAADRLDAQFRGDPDPLVKVIVEDARIDRWLAGHPRLPQAFASMLRRLLRQAARLRYREPRGIAYPSAPRSMGVRVLGRTVTCLGRLLQVAAIAVVVVFATRANSEGQTTSSPALVSVALGIAGQLTVLFGQRLRGGRFTAEMLRLEPRQLPRTIAIAVLTLALVWLSPGLERAGSAYVYGLPRETYRGLRETGLPVWADIAMMIFIAPIEILVLLIMFSAGPLKAFKKLLGDKNPAVEAAEEQFGSVHMESDEEQ